MFIYLPFFISVCTTDHTSEMPLLIAKEEKNISPVGTGGVLILRLMLFFEAFKFASVQDVHQSRFSGDEVTK